MRQLPLGVRLRDRAVFGSFLAGDNQALLQHLHLLRTTARGAVTWIGAPPGAGKTHLLQALCAQQAETAVAAYLPLRELKDMGPDALSGWQHAQCLCVDDIDAVLGRIEWERALFALYREAEERGALLVVAAAAPPRHMAFALPDLGSRFAASAIFALQPLDESQQREALRLHARQRGLELPEDTALYLQRRLPRDMESMCALLDELDAASLQAQRRLTIPFIREVLAQRPA